MFPQAYKEQYDTQGYVIIPNLISKDLLPLLHASCERVIGKTRSGEWSLRRVVGKQFPPYGDGNPDSWGVQHVMHPDLGEDAEVFKKWYTSDELVEAVKGLIPCKEEELEMELFNLLINPEAHNFALSWHRDDVRADASEAQEKEALGIWHHGVQWNTALYEDSCLYLVPGSHKTPRTPEQRARSETTEPPKDPLDMPGAIKVTLKPGETAFYNNNILHCATYSSDAKRVTLHACMGSTKGGQTRARNILQHGLEWMRDDGRFRAGFDDRGKAMLDRLVELVDRGNVNGKEAYSLVG